MSLDIYLDGASCDHCKRGGEEVFSANITHNLRRMWDEASVCDALYESQGKTAASILPALESGLAVMQADPARFEAFNAPNGWGLYKHAVPWLAEVVRACRENPAAVVRVSR